MFIDIGNKKIEYEIRGKGEPFLFVHGWGGTINSLRALSEYASCDFQTINLSLPGFGQSDLPNSDWGVAEYADFLIRFLDKLKIHKIYYFGHW